MARIYVKGKNEDNRKNERRKEEMKWYNAVGKERTKMLERMKEETKKEMAPFRG